MLFILHRNQSFHPFPSSIYSISLPIIQTLQFLLIICYLLPPHNLTNPINYRTDNPKHVLVSQSPPNIQILKHIAISSLFLQFLTFWCTAGSIGCLYWRDENKSSWSHYKNYIILQGFNYIQMFEFLVFVLNESIEREIHTSSLYTAPFFLPSLRPFHFATV